MPKTIKEIMLKFEKTLGGLVKTKHFKDEEAYKETRDFLLSSLLSLLDEVERRLNEDGDCYAIKNILSDLRKEIN